MRRTIRANYTSSCGKCGLKIFIGDSIFWYDESSRKYPNVGFHEYCDPDEDEDGNSDPYKDLYEED